MPRRRPGQLLPLERRILETGLGLQTADAGFHGFLLAAALSATDESTALTAHGTLYKALGRMADAGLLAAAWEDPAIAASAGRPRRRLYRVTAEGATALAAARAVAPADAAPSRAARGIA
ncbi:MAG TPA: helix-turn-helix transcriptional regulator [Pseudolysinimonas sp.]|nr:helix-turn-helix transcriptional regulator [Pseudolysinimonas sp.]